jgi:organic radical activating enzyme
MLNRSRPAECNYCWRVEDQGSISDRVTKSFTPWSRRYFKEIITSGANADIPKYVEVSFDNTCNLKCSYCGPDYSSKWVEDLSKHGDWPNYHKKDNFVLIKNEDNPYVEAFWQWWPELSKELHTFRITGGEPLINKNTFKILDWLIENPNKNLNLGINSNLMIPKRILKQLTDRLKKLTVGSLTVHASCDAYGTAAEYARHGLDYDQWVDNCQYLLSEVPNLKLNIMVTYNIFSVTTFESFLKDVVKLKTKKWYQRQRVSMSIAYLRDPEFLSIWTLPPDYVKFIEEQVVYMKTNKFTTKEVNQLERLIPLFVQDQTVRNSLQKQFVNFVDEHDKRRGSNFLKAIPTLSEFYKLCK